MSHHRVHTSFSFNLQICVQCRTLERAGILACVSRPADLSDTLSPPPLSRRRKLKPSDKIEKHEFDVAVGETTDDRSFVVKRKMEKLGFSVDSCGRRAGHRQVSTNVPPLRPATGRTPNVSCTGVQIVNLPPRPPTNEHNCNFFFQGSVIYRGIVVCCWRRVSYLVRYCLV